LDEAREPEEEPAARKVNGLESSAQGRRRSSTNAEKFLRRQQQAVVQPLEACVEDGKKLSSDPSR